LAGVSLTLATAVIQLFLRPDPYLTAAHHRASELKPPSTESTFETIRSITHQPQAFFAISAIGIGHLVMVAIMVMTPVHMAHVDVTLSIIGLVISVHVAGMYSLSPLVGYFSDRFGRIKTIQLGVCILLLAALVSGLSPGNNASTLALGLFLLGLGWSCTLIGGSTLLSEAVEEESRTAAQGSSDLIMNLMGAAGGVTAGIIISALSYGWLCLFASIPVLILGIWTLRVR
jgi:MFS family permease